MIEGVLQGVWKDLKNALSYDSGVAQRILVGALVYYLDERFSITDRRKLGWT